MESSFSEKSMHGTPLLSAKGNHDQGGYASGEDGVDHQQKMALPPQQQQQQPNYPGPNGQHQQPPPTLQAPPAMAYQQQQQLQVNLCQKYLFSHQLTHNMTKDCSIIYQFNR